MSTLMLYNQFYDKNVFIPLNYKWTLVLHTRLDDIERSMKSSPFDSTYDQTTSGVACHQHPWIEKHDQAISGVAYHHRPWIAKHDQTTLGVACHHGHWEIHTVR